MGFNKRILYLLLEICLQGRFQVRMRKSNAEDVPMGRKTSLIFTALQGLR
jgi:hypothetical protein